MNILHVTDFHYSAENSVQMKVVESIIRTLSNEELKIDLVLFTGDLVDNGSLIESFQEAGIALFNSLSKKLGIKKENIIFCPGNHDIDRTEIHGAMKSYFDSFITSDESLNAFYKKKDDDVYIDSVKPSFNFYSFLTKFHNPNDDNIISQQYSIHFRKIKEKRIGIACINSAWVSGLDKNKPGKEDKGNLLIPLNLLEEIKLKMGSVDKRIILFHHPLYFLKEFNFYKVESFIHNEFDLMFSGHVHKISSLSRHSGTNGIFEHVAKASLTSKENLGCTIIRLDEIEENVIRVNELTYMPDDEICHFGQEITHTVPCGAEKIEIIAFRKKLFEKILLEKENANNLLLVGSSDKKEDFLTLYCHPVLKKESEGSLETKNAVSYSLEELIKLESNYVILGKDKCGKTSLLRRIQIECLINYSRNGKIPFFFDAREYESKLDANFDLVQLIRNYFGINKNKALDILSSGNLILLIDNYSPNSSMAEYLNKLFLDNPSITYLICTEYNLSRTVDFFQLGNSIYDKLYFHDLRRTEIITYTEKRLSITDNKEEIQTKIIQLCKQLELPLNYWTISLLLLIHDKSSDSYSKNIFSILDICVDEIFGKKRLLLSRSKISFEQIKSICADLAQYLFLNHESNIYSASYNSVLDQIDKSIMANERISANSKDVFDYLLSCSIIKKKNDTDLYVFRLNGFFEYFLALKMTRDISFRDEILNNDVLYLAFKNQLEIYCGFNKSDFDFLLKVFAKSQNKIDTIFTSYNKDKDKELLDKIKEPEILEDVCRKVSIKRALSTAEKAEIEDLVDNLSIDADVHEIKTLNPDEISIEVIERYLFILSRTFRNLDDITGHKEKLTEIFNYIVAAYCDFGFFVIDTFSKDVKNEIENENMKSVDDFPELDLLRFISNFSPLLSQTWLYDGVGHFSIERMIKDEINKIEKDASKFQYKLFVLYFLLLDIDLNSNRQYISIAMDKLTIPLLKYLLYIKLNYYLAFKSANNVTLQKELAAYIKKAQINLDSSSSLSDIQKQIQIKKRMSLINSKKA